MALVESGPGIATDISSIMLETTRAFNADLALFFCTNEELTRQDVDRLFYHRHQWFGDNSKKVKTLLLVLHSPGGDLGAAYQLVGLLRRRSERLVVAVPRWAKSAATLVCLGADEIVMSEIAELGPIDPQVRRPGEAVHRPALDEFLALPAVIRESIVAYDGFMQMVIQKTRMDPKELVHPIGSLVAGLMAPVLAQVNPIVTGGHTRTLQVSQQYAMRVLNRWGTASKPSGSIAYQLTREYPSHDFVLDVEELKLLGLNARLASQAEEACLAAMIPYLNDPDFRLIRSTLDIRNLETFDTNDVSDAAATTENFENEVDDHEDAPTVS